MKEKVCFKLIFFLSLQFLRVIRGASLVQWFPNLTGTGHLESLYVGCFKAGSWKDVTVVQFASREPGLFSDGSGFMAILRQAWR